MEPSSHKSLVLCFDGTGNKFQGTQSDSNIVKIFSLLDKQDANQFHYYQPGIGTYVETSSLARKSRFGRIHSWYLKAKDQAIGTSFGEHVMSGYKFLMRYYSPGDAIYFFGFSRGAYTARFLAQMLDYVGLLSTGNEEMLRFAWKTFAQWQMRTDETKKGKEEKHKLFEFMRSFRETFSRPTDPVRFLGLFDCVNSVPQFESAWMQRTKFPYTAKTSARFIRHAVSIDERRAKFRQDLISEQRQVVAEHGSARHHHHHSDRHDSVNVAAREPGEPGREGPPELKRAPTNNQARFRRTRQGPQLKPMRSMENSLNDASSMTGSQMSVDSTTIARERRTADAHDHDVTTSNEDEQDILEVWFAGQHADIGGGWLCEDHERPASDVPLIWMLREAKRAGMPFDEEALERHGLLHNIVASSETPVLQLDGNPLPRTNSSAFQTPLVGTDEDMHRLQTATRLHDSLAFGGGMSWTGVCAWQFMEYLPFRRMDLQPDGSWKPISWPLPRGETRDIPADAIIHGSVIRRMEVDQDYRPGNLIVGGGGRGIRRAPAEAGTGAWRVVREHGDRIGEAVVKVKDGEKASHMEGS